MICFYDNVPAANLLQRRSAQKHANMLRMSLPIKAFQQLAPSQESAFSIRFFAFPFPMNWLITPFLFLSPVQSPQHYQHY